MPLQEDLPETDPKIRIEFGLDDDVYQRMLKLLDTVLTSTDIDGEADLDNWNGKDSLTLKTRTSGKPIDLQSFLRYAKSEGVELSIVPMEIMGEKHFQVHCTLGRIVVEIPETLQNQ